ncbi:MAG: glutamate--tRNA ligase [Nanoarchaeota archaeon]
MKDLLKKYVLQNILKYGKPDKHSIIGKIFAENPRLKDKKAAIFKELDAVIASVASLSKPEQEKEFSVYAGSFQPPQQRERNIVSSKQFRPLPELPAVEGREHIFRIEISPSGAGTHIGRGILLLLNAEYAKKYKGKFIVRISDTDPDKVDPAAYQVIVEEAKWLTENKVDEVIIQSERMDIYYLYAKQLIDLKKAYVCTCAVESFRELILKQEACPCRDLSAKEQTVRWHQMFTTYQQGEAVLRVKTDLQHPNPAVRDWPAFRINESEHVRQGKKYRVWPLMNFAVPVDDHENGMTHIIRGKDHIVNKDRQLYIYKYFDWWVPHFVHIGKINFVGMKLKTSLTKEEIKNKKYAGWDDIKLPFVGALRRRGFLPASLIKYAHEIGPSKVDKTVPYDTFMQAIASYNKEFIDASTKRYFFVEKPKKITIKGAPNITAHAPLHPDDPSKGERILETGKDFYIQDTLEKNKLYRFMHLFNFKNKTFHSEPYDQALKATLIHWLPVCDDLVPVWIHCQDGTVKKGLGEPGLRDLKVHEIIQFERVGFCKLDAKEKDKLIFWYGHR